MIWAVANNHHSLASLLIDSGKVEINLKDEGCALHYAVINQNNVMLKRLLNFPNVDVNIVDKDGWNALQHAVVENNIEGLKLLLGHKPDIDVNWKTKKGNCALYMAVYFKNNEALKLLLPHVDVNIVKDGGLNAVHVAVARNNIEALKLLLTHPQLTALTLNHKDKRRSATPLMWAAMKNNLEAAAVLAADPRVECWRMEGKVLTYGGVGVLRDRFASFIFLTDSSNILNPSPIVLPLNISVVITGYIRRRSTWKATAEGSRRQITAMTLASGPAVVSSRVAGIKGINIYLSEGDNDNRITC